MDRSVSGVRRALLAQMSPRALPAELWLAAIFVMTGANLLDFAVAGGSALGGSALIGSTLLRIIAVLWIGHALIRAMAGAPRPFAPGMTLLRYGAITLLLLVGFGIFARIAVVAAGPDAEIANQWLAMVIANGIWAGFTIGLLAWQAALAIGDRGVPLRGLYARQRGTLLPLWLAFAAIVLPFAAIHGALVIIGGRLALSGTALAALALIDGIVSAIQLVAACALTVVAWRLASPPLHEDVASR